MSEKVNKNICFLCDKEDSRLYEIPDTPDSTVKWLKALGIEDEKVLESAIDNSAAKIQLCSKHFTVKAFTTPRKLKLTKNAIPTLHLKMSPTKKNFFCRLIKKEYQQKELVANQATVDSTVKKSDSKKEKVSLAEKKIEEQSKQPEELMEMLFEEDIPISDKQEEVDVQQVKQEHIKIESKYRCRLCLDYFENIISLFSVNESQQKPYIEMLKSFVSLRINEDENFENVVCEVCAENVQMAYSFQQLCLQSDMILFGSESGGESNAHDHSYEKIQESQSNTIRYNDVEYIEINDETGVKTTTQMDWEEVFEAGNTSVESSDGNWIEADGQVEETLCDLCGKYVISTLYRKHRKRHHYGAKNFKCQYCDKRFWTEANLEIHELSYHQEIQTLYQCELCEKLFISESKLDKHYETTHTAPQPQPAKSPSRSSAKAKFVCDICGVSVSQRNIETHSLLHMVQGGDINTITVHKQGDSGASVAGSNKCLCDICGTQILTSNLTLHMQKHDPNRTKDFKCSYCDSRFFNKHNCKYHEKVMHGPEDDGAELVTGDPLDANIDSGKKRKRKPVAKKYVCNECGARAPSQILLLNHLTLHDPTREKIRKYKCKYCEKRFTQGAHVKTHELLHTGDKPYKCEYCGKRFRHLTTINDHKRIHTGKTPYHCEVCNRKFNSQTNFKKHMASHDYYVNKNVVKVETVEVDQIIDAEDM